MNPYQPPSDMTPEQKALIEEENECRRLFAEEPSNARLSDPHLLLVNVFNNFDSFVYAEETPEEKKVPKLLTHHRRLDAKGSAINAKHIFLDNWNEFTQGCLSGLDWNNVFVAGGAVLGCLSSAQDGYRSSDIDLFVCGITDETQANEKLKSIYNTVLNNTKGKGDVIRTKRAITILCSYPYRHVQVILRLYKSPAEVLLGFDIDSCCVGFDGKDVWCQERFKRALTKRYNLVNISRRSLTYESRLFKYSKRGFAVAVPNLDKSRVDTRLFSKDFRDVSGLAKLVLYDFKQGSKSAAFSRPRAKAIPEEGSDYNNDLPIPWGPGWNTEVILNLLESKNRAKFFASVRKNKDTEKTEPKGKDKAYNHMFTSDAEGLRSGNFETWKRSLDSKEVQHPLEWIKDNPAYQDYDNGFRRLMTSSFEPVVDANWETSVYLPDGATASPEVLAQKYLSTDDSSISDSKHSPGKGHASLGFQVSPAKKTAEKKSVSFGGGFAQDKPRAVPESKPVVAAKRPPQSFTPATTSFGGTFGSTFGAAPSSFTPLSTTPASTTFGGFGADTGFNVGTTSGGSVGFDLTAPFNAPSTAYSAVTGGTTPPEPTSGFYPLDNNNVRRQLEEARKSGKRKQSDIGIFGPQPGSFGAEPATPTKQHTFDMGLTPPPSPSLLAFSTFGHGTPASQPQAQPSFLQPQPAVLVPPSLPSFSQPQPAYSPSQPSFSQAPVSLPSLSGGQAQPTVIRVGGALPTPATPTTKLLLLIALLSKKGLVSGDEKGLLKDLTLSKNDLVLSALEVFEIDQDLNELADTLRRICKHHKY